MSQLIDLSKLPAPDVLEALDYESLLAERKAKFISLYPESERDFWRARLALESEPIVKLLEENCYLQLLERQRINNAAKATMLAYATGTDLDVIAANFNVRRLVVQEAQPNAPPLSLKFWKATPIYAYAPNWPLKGYQWLAHALPMYFTHYLRTPKWLMCLLCHHHPHKSR